MMKTFFLALILGIFLGSIVTHYFADPLAYENLKEAKSRLFAQDSEAEAETAELEASDPAEPATFDVGSGNLDANQEPEANVPQPRPLPQSKTEAELQTEEPSKAEPELTEEKAPAPQPPSLAPEPEKKLEPEPEVKEELLEKPPEDPIAEAAPNEEEATVVKSRSEELIEEGAQKAEEIVGNVTDKAKQVAEDAKPLLEEGIDLTIAAGIRAQYKLDRRIHSDAITISVKDNVVTLSGTVDSEETRQLAIKIAAFTKGVDGVEETLSIAK